MNRKPQGNYKHGVHAKWGLVKLTGRAYHCDIEVPPQVLCNPGNCIFAN